MCFAVISPLVQKFGNDRGVRRIGGDNQHRILFFTHASITDDMERTPFTSPMMLKHRELSLSIFVLKQDQGSLNMILLTLKRSKQASSNSSYGGSRVEDSTVSRHFSCLQCIYDLFGDRFVADKNNSLGFELLVKVLLVPANASIYATAGLTL